MSFYDELKGTPRAKLTDRNRASQFKTLLTVSLRRIDIPDEKWRLENIDADDLPLGHRTVGRNLAIEAESVIWGTVAIELTSPMDQLGVPVRGHLLPDGGLTVHIAGIEVNQSEEAYGLLKERLKDLREAMVQ